MKIAAIQVTRANLELTRPYTIAYKTVSFVENVLVEMILENGIIGLGSANPSKQVVGEDLDDTMKALKSLDFLLHRDIREFRKLLSEVQEMFPSSPGARAALDIALHDAFCRFLGIPLADFLGRRIKSLPTSITIGIKNTADTLSEAREYVDRGFFVLKVKLGISPEEDLERLTCLHKTFGDRIVIRVDANQGYTSNQLIRFFDKVKSFKLELIEQPLAAKAITEMKQLPSNIRKQIAADESLVNSQDAFRLAESPVSCGIFNIKLMKCGGIFPALQIADIAHYSGIDLMWGCNDESIISITAALHVAFSCPHTRYIDLDGSFDLAKDLVEGGFMLKNGMMSLYDLPGLGVRRLST
ncbi:MAG TPA: dipeptide epimerase [Chitinophagaceae bacterium]|nr:dipeptide epimerase [Chitinophagaceae bacterium]